MADGSPPKAVVLVSGGMDSATALAVAVDSGLACYALSFDYGQRHRCELEAAASVARSLGARDHVVVNLDLRALGGSALTATEIDVPRDRPPDEMSSGVPVTYVPARNTVFLSVALGYAEVLEADEIHIGVSALDYSGYPDCRPEFVRAFEVMARLATRRGIEGHPTSIRTPLIELTKGQIIQRGLELGVDYALTFSCYDPDQAGRPCGRCDACRLRAKGFAEAGVADPAVS